MNVFVINLDSDTVKMSVMADQLQRLRIAFCRVPGVRGDSIPQEARKAFVDRFRWWCAVGRPIVPAEIGVALAHASIYKQLQPTEAACIFEDDVIISDSLNERLDAVRRVIDTGRPQVYLLSDHQHHYDGVRGVVRSCDGICSDGYIITYPAARLLLKENFPMKVPCDHWFRWAKMGLVEEYHVLPAVIAQNQARFGTTTQANAEDVSNYPFVRWFCHKFKRLVGKCVDSILLGMRR